MCVACGEKQTLIDRFIDMQDQLTKLVVSINDARCGEANDKRASQALLQEMMQSVKSLNHALWEEKRRVTERDRELESSKVRS